MDDLISDFLNELKLGSLDLKDLEGQLIERSLLINKDDYLNLIPYIDKFKKYGLSSSSLTGLHKNASDIQKWPILNLLRQILKSRGYTLNPKRVSDGSDNEGKKKYKRYFIIKKYDNEEIK